MTSAGAKKSLFFSLLATFRKVIQGHSANDIRIACCIQILTQYHPDSAEHLVKEEQRGTLDLSFFHVPTRGRYDILFLCYRRLAG